ncbi:MAG: response regulator transcription factor, partial [Opitutaceae bacterium]
MPFDSSAASANADSTSSVLWVAIVVDARSGEEASCEWLVFEGASRETLLDALSEARVGGLPSEGPIACKVVAQAVRQFRCRRTSSDGLSPREEEVLALIARGYLFKEIADAIGVSLPTVKTYIRRIYEKLRVHSRAQAVALYTNFPLREDG